MRKSFLLIIVAMALRLAFGAVTSHFAADCRDGARLVTVAGTYLIYDATWYDRGEQVYLTDNGAPILSGVVGTHRWTPTDDKLHYLQMIVTDSSGVIVAEETAGFMLPSLNNSVAIPDGWHEIPRGLFKNCDWLTSVLIPSSVTNIDVSAFMGCTNVQCITVPDWVSVASVFCASKESIIRVGLSSAKGFVADGGYAGCSSLERISIPSGLSRFGVDAFSGCAKLSRVDVPSLADWMKIDFPNASANPLCTGADLFADGQKVTNLLIPKATTAIGSYVFQGGRFASVSIPASVTNVAATAFDGCDQLKTVVLDSPMLSVQSMMPSICAGITEVEVRGCVEVPSGLFDGCSSLERVILPAGVRKINVGELLPCERLQRIDFASLSDCMTADLGVDCATLQAHGVALSVNGQSLESMRRFDVNGYWIVDGWVLGHSDPASSQLEVPDGVVGIGREALADFSDLENVALPSTIRHLAAGAFANDTYLDGVVLPDSVEVIGAGAFENCSWMQTMTMGAGVKVVGDRAFAGCTKMATVSFAEGLDEIGDAAFSNCWRMLSVALPVSVTNVAATAFTDCSSLKGVTVPTAVAPLSTWFAPVYRQIEDVTVPDGTTEVCAEMFAGCAALKSVSLPEGVTNIACGAFRNCSELETILLPESLTAIGDEAFAGCAALKAIVLPEHVATIGKRAFSGCSSLADVTLSRALTAIPDGTFAGCAALDSFVVPASVTQLGSQIVPSATTAIYYLGNAPTVAADVYAQANAALVSYVVNGTKGWDGRPTSRDIPQSWPVDNARAIQFWSPVREVKVRFNATGGTVEPDERSYVSEAAFGELPVPTRTHYDFVGWFTEAIGGSQMTVASEVPLADRELFAHWTPKQYVILFHANDGTGATVDQSFVYGATVGLRTNDFVRTGYAFAGWATRLDGGAVYADGRLLTNVSAVEDGVIHLYAVWTPHDYWVRFDSNDGTGAMEAIKFAYDEEGALSTNAFARTGYRFAGWAMDRAARPESAPYREGETVRNLTAEDGATVTLYAVWEAHAYRISYNANGGDGEMVDAPCTYDLDTTVAANAFTRLGYRFVGWSLDAAARPESAPYREGETVRNLTAEDGATVTLYAVWEADDDLWHDDGCFSGSAANVYDGCLLDQDESLIGLVQVKTAKQVVKGGDTNVTTTATVTDQTGKTWSYSKGTASVDGTVSGLVCTTKGCPVPKFDVVLGKNGLSGDWGGYEIVGARRVKPGDYAKNWTVSFANGDWLQLKVDAAGVAKVVGWAAGKAYSASTQLIVGDGFAYVPVLSGKNATLIRIENPASGGEHPVGVITSTSGEEARGGVTAKPQFDGWEESDNAMVGVAFRTVPRMDGLGWPMTFKASGLPSGCKINEKTGVVSGIPTKAGTFVAKVTATSASNKKWTATCAVTNSIVALPEWAKGQFAGVADGADVTMTVGSTGKVSGKFKVGITNWTFAASSFTTNSVTRGVTNLICAATAQGTYSYKSGKTTKTAKVAEPLEFALFAQPDVSPLAAAGVGDFADATENVGLWRVAAVKLTADGAGGTVKTDKSYGQAAAGGKVKLTATLKKGWAFLGWYDLAGESDGPVSQATTYALVSDGVTDRFLEARFVKEAELSAADFELAWNAPTNVCCGVSYSAKPSVSGAAAVKIASVTGLPKGLAWASGKATGVPTSVQTNTVTVKFALVTNAKKTFAQKFRLAVNPLPDWAVQTLAGDLGTEESPVPVTVTIGSKGAVSGKYVLNGNEKWTFSAKALSSAEYDAITQEPLSFEAKVTASATIKNKKRTQNLLVTVLPEGVAVDER